MLVNVAIGEEQPLQILDADGNELSSHDWTVDSPELAEIKEESGHAVLHPKAAGFVHVVAMHEAATLTEEISIWGLTPRMFIVGTHWVVPSTGRQLGFVQAAPTLDGGPDLFTLDQTDSGISVRGFTNRGLQLWIWSLPRAAGVAELICGDNLGGAVLSVTRHDSYTIYVVGKNGKLQWQRKFDGVRKGYALNPSNLFHLLTQSVDGTSATIRALDGASGVEKFKLTIPASYERQVNVRRSNGRILCASGASETSPLRRETSGLFVNTDGDAYAAFSQKHWVLGTDKCVPQSEVDPRKLYFSRDDQLVLWRIAPDGSHRETIVDTAKQSRVPLSTPGNVISPTGDIIPDGFGGVLFSARSSPREETAKAGDLSQEFVYRVTEDGELAFKFPLPKYSGKLHDEMVLGEQDLGFATRGSVLIAFNVRDGSEVWRWNSGIGELQINMATGGGGCAVETPEGMILVEDGERKRVLAPPGSEMYAPGAFLVNDPHGVAMLGAGIKPD